MTVAERYKQVAERFHQNMPAPKTELNYTDNYELLVAVILSAQCTDKRVNIVTPAFFKEFPTPDELAKAEFGQVFALISSISYPNNKAKLLIGMAKRLVDEFNGQVPDDMDALLSLPGVGRKTANVILSVAFDRPAMAVDTHVFRVANRIGLTNNSKTPLETERTLVKHFSSDVLATAHHWLILHGRYVCKARKPLCGECFLTDLCKYYSKGEK